MGMNECRCVCVCVARALLVRMQRPSSLSSSSSSLSALFHHCSRPTLLLTFVIPDMYDFTLHPYNSIIVVRWTKILKKKKKRNQNFFQNINVKSQKLNLVKYHLTCFSVVAGCWLPFVHNVIWCENRGLGRFIHSMWDQEREPTGAIKRVNEQKYNYVSYSLSRNFSAFIRSRLPLAYYKLNFSFTVPSHLPSLHRQTKSFSKKLVLSPHNKMQ